MTPGCLPARLPLAAPRRGFTIIELMIALLVVGVLVTIAYPSFMDQMRKSRRADAVAALTTVQQAQERWRSNQTSYAAGFNTAAAGVSANGLTVSSQSASNYYLLSIGGTSATGYTVVATATESGPQALDGGCRLMGVRAEGGNLRYGSGATSIDWAAADPDAGNCWAR